MKHIQDEGVGQTLGTNRESMDLFTKFSRVHNVPKKKVLVRSV